MFYKDSKFQCALLHSLRAVGTMVRYEVCSHLVGTGEVLGPMINGDIR